MDMVRQDYFNECKEVTASHWYRFDRDLSRTKLLVSSLAELVDEKDSEIEDVYSRQVYTFIYDGDDGPPITSEFPSPDRTEFMLKTITGKSLYFDLSKKDEVETISYCGDMEI